jgi:hypothetical protein
MKSNDVKNSVPIFYRKNKCFKNLPLFRYARKESLHVKLELKLAMVTEDYPLASLQPPESREKKQSKIC